MMEALPVCVELLSRLPVRDLKTMRRIGAVKEACGGGDGGEDDVGGHGLDGMQASDQRGGGDDEGGGGGRRGDDDEEAERKLRAEAVKALKKKKIAVYRCGRTMISVELTQRPSLSPCCLAFLGQSAP